MASKQQHYRRLMKEQKSKQGSSSEQSIIDHPLAKYNSVGQLLCVICNQQIKSNILWITHLKSRKHKDAVTAFKSQKSGTSSTLQQRPSPATVTSSSPSSSSHTSKASQGKDRLHEEQVTSGASSRKRALPDEGSLTSGSLPQTKKKKSRHKMKTPDSVSSGLPADFFDTGVKKKFYPKGEEPMYDLSDDEADLPIAVPVVPSTNGAPKIVIDKIIPAPAAALPADFFDAKQPASVPEEGTSSEGLKGKGNLPEGFFDDPKKDAKARNVEYKDPILDEWEKFQKSIQKEDDVSEAILVEGDEEAMEDRELDEVNEQVRFFTKAEELRLKHEELLSKRNAQDTDDQDKEESMDSQSFSEDEEDFDEFLNWRDKVS